ncbi:MAG: VCBS repeat-containing protein, partial [Myxococcota bacterium]|nr:VCBS repeat-containing protein [Myxococcota bacterium]
MTKLSRSSASKRLLRWMFFFTATVWLNWGCGGGPPGDWNDEDGYRWRTLSVSRFGGQGFTQLESSRTGIVFQNSVSERLMERNRHLAQGSGVALGDVDGDGLVDIYFARIDGPNALYRNLGNWRFEEVAADAGVDAVDRYSTGATFADVDGDSDVDLLVTAIGGPNSLFLNDGSGVFSDATESSGLVSNRGSMTMTLADVDSDGDLDLYVANYKVRTVNDIYGPRELQFNRVVRRLGDRNYEVVSAFREHYRVQVREDLDVVVRSERGEPDWFYLNDGAGRFQPVTFTSGRFLDEHGNPISDVPDYFALSAKFQDIDGDNDPDLFVCADFEDPDLIWLNDGS